MKRVLPYRELSEREVPEALDFRILARAAARGRERKFRRRFAVWGGIAATVCVTALTGVLFQIEHESRTKAHLELLAMGDFSRLDQSGYNMSFELGSGVDLNRF